MVILIILLFLTDVFLGFFVWNLLRKLERAEEDLDTLVKEFREHQKKGTTK